MFTSKNGTFMQTKINRNVRGIALTTAICLIGDSMLYVVLPLYYKEVGLTSLWQVGVLLSANRLIRLPLSPFIAWLFERITIRSGMWIAVTIAITTTLLYGWVEGFIGLLLVRCFWGVGWSLFRMVGFMTVVSYSETGNRGELMGTYNGFFRLGSLGGMLAGGILADVLGLKIVAIIMGFIMFSAIPMAAAWSPAASTSNKEENISGYQKMGSIELFQGPGSAYFIGMLLTGFLMAMVYQGLYTSTVSHMIGVRIPLDWTFLGFALGAAAVAGSLQALRWTWDPWLSPWIGRIIDTRCSRTLMLIISLMAASVLFMLVSANMPFTFWLLILIAIMITGTMMHTVVDSMMADRAAAGSSTRIITLYTLASDIGASIGPALAFTFMDTFDPSSVYLFSGFTLLLLAGYWCWRKIKMKGIHKNERGTKYTKK